MVRRVFENASDKSASKTGSLDKEAAESAVLEGISIPDNVPYSSKVIDENVQAELIMSAQALKELGGYKNVDRVFQSVVDEERVFILMTEAELKHSESDAYRKVAEGETPIEARIRYIEEAYGNFLETDTDYVALDAEGKAKGWLKVFDKENVFSSGDGTAVSIVYLDPEVFLKSFDLEGSRQQKIDFLLGHELDHGDNHDVKHSGPKGLFAEVESDKAGILGIQGAAHPLAFWSKRVDKQDFARSVVAERVEHEISRIVIGEGVFSSFRSDRWDHNTGFFINTDSLQDSAVFEGAQSALKEFGELIIEQAKQDLINILKENYELPTDPVELISSSDLLIHSIITENFNDVLKVMDVPQEVKDKYKEQARDLQREDHEVPKAKRLFESIMDAYPEEFPRALAGALYDTYYEDIDDFLENSGLPSALVEAYEEELDHIENIDDEKEYTQTVRDFMKRFVDAHPDIYRSYVEEEAKGLVIVSAYDGDKEAWEKSIAEMTLNLYRSEKIENPNIKNAVQIYLEENNLLHKENPGPAIEQVPDV